MKLVSDQPIFHIHAELADIRHFGRTPYGERRVIDILGGRVDGPRLAGRILPGADWQIVWTDGTADLTARYGIETDAGARILVRSDGLRHGVPEVLAALARGEQVEPDRYYFRTAMASRPRTHPSIGSTASLPSPVAHAKGTRCTSTSTKCSENMVERAGLESAMNRRSVLGLTATTAIGLAMARFAAQAAVSAPMNALSEYMSAAGTRALPPEVAEHAKHHLIDTLASMISGSDLPPGQAAQRYIGTHGGKGAATIAGTALTAAPVEAALANGVMAHADETDDSHNASRSHPGCAVVPAAIAVGEEVGIDGARLLRAVTLGYDVGARVIMAMGGAEWSYDTSLATHSIAGTFGAAAAAACAAGLDARQMRWALDYTAQQSSGIVAWRRDTDHIEKAFVFGGMPARNGVTSALVARTGWNGVDDIFSGADNFFLAYAPKAQPARLIEKLGERYEIVQTDIKKWTVGSPIQGPLDAIEAIRGKRPFEADQVKRVTVRLAPSVATVVDNRDIPDICLQHMVAVMLLDKTVSFHAAHDKPRLQDAAALRERAKVNLVRDQELVQFLPVRVTVVEIELADGTLLSERVSAVRGTPRNPMSRTEVIDKARDLTAPIIGRETAAKLIETIFAIESVADIRTLRPLLQRG